EGEARRTLVDLRGVEDPGRQPLGRDDPLDAAEPVELGLGLRNEEVPSLPEPDVVAEVGPEPSVVLDRLPGEPDGRHGLPLLPNPAPVPPRCPGGKEPPVEHHDRPAAGRGEVMGGVEPDDTGPDD